MQAELILDARATLAEGPFWDPRNATLYWVDIPNGEVHLFNPATGSDRCIAVNQMVGTVVPCESGGVAIALEHHFALLEVESETLTPFGPTVTDDADLRFNDGKCDPAGRFWAGTISKSRRPGAAALYRLDPDGSVQRMLDGVTNSNGITWSLDGRTMYYIDTPTQRVDAFDFDPRRGTIANRRPVAHLPESDARHRPDGMTPHRPDGMTPHRPDGMTIDAEGMLWVAVFRGGCVLRLDPATGQTIGRVDLPVTNVTACAFGGPDLDEFYITTARAALDETQLAEQPQAGGIFRARPGIRGIELPRFTGSVRG